MDNQPKLLNPPPRLITAIVTGFNAVANHIYLILPPVVLDIFLWLGPRLSLERILSPVIAEMNITFQQLGNADMTQLMESTSELWKQFAQQFNFFSVLRTLPVGIPSLMAGSVDAKSPLGSFIRLEVNSSTGMMLIGIVMALFGMLLGCFYFSAVSHSSGGNRGQSFWRCSAWQATQTLLLSLLSIALLLTITIPGMFVISLLSLISPTVATIALFLVGLLAIWFVIPLVFSPHGIFTRQQNAVTSMLSSVRLVRYLMPSVSLFLLVAVLLIQGLNRLWLVPPANSWLTLIGIAGHAFVTTGMLSASFVFYRNATAWLDENMALINQVRI